LLLKLSLSFFRSNYELLYTLKNVSDVGQVRVHVLSAKGLYGADFGGKSDPFAVVK
jgi:hypothetical protein